MADLISRVRLLIADPSGGSEQFADQDVQDVLDLSRVNVFNALLRPAVTLVSNGVLNYSDYFADIGNWESDAVIRTANFTIATDMATSDYLTGHWTWSLANPGKVPPLFITGKYYDIYQASAELLERWAAALTASYDFTSDGQVFKRSQQVRMKLDLANTYRRWALPKSVPLIRNDAWDDTSSTNVVVGNTDVMGW